jgi:hypothetical protein
MVKSLVHRPYGTSGICILVEKVSEDLDVLLHEESHCVLIFLFLHAEVKELKLFEFLQDQAPFQSLLVSLFIFWEQGYASLV